MKCKSFSGSLILFLSTATFLVCSSLLAQVPTISDAARKCDLPAMRAAVANGANLNATYFVSEDMFEPLETWVFQQALDCDRPFMEALIKLGASTRPPVSRRGMAWVLSPLPRAIASNKLSSFESLLVLGFEPKVDSDDCPLAALAIITPGRERFLDLLLRHGADPNESAYCPNAYIDPLPLVHLSVETRNHPALKVLVDAHADLEAVPIVGFTLRALHRAVSGNDLESVRILVDGKARINSRDKMGRTPLQLAADLPDKRIYEYLKSKGAREQ